MKEYQSKVIEKNFLTSNILELVLEVDGDFNFIPGQFVQFIIEEKVNRAYSITSLPSDLPSLRFLIHLEEGGVGSEFIRAKNIGEIITFRGPVGQFVWKDKSATTIFVATGVGLAPFISMLDDGLASASNAVLVFGTREPQALFYKQKFENLEIEHDNFSYLPILSGVAEGWTGERGRVDKLLPDLVKSFPQAIFFLCGGAEMVRDARALLLTSGVSMQNIKIEIFT